MRSDGRLSGALHVLLHMAGRGGAVTSQALAAALDTNPVVIRRILAGLREHGYVRSERGHGGGWTLVCDPGNVTLRDVYTALGGPSLLAIGNRTESPDCLVEQAVNASLTDAFRAAEAALLARLDDVTLAALSDDVRDRSLVHGQRHELEDVHAL